MGGRTRHARLAALALAAALGVSMGVSAAAAATGTGRLGVVITPGQVFISWKQPAIEVAHVYAYRAPTCAASATRQRIRPYGPSSQVIDQSVTAGNTYCYSVYVSDASGTKVLLGTTGLLTIPAANGPTPAPVPVATPVAVAQPSSGSSLDTSTIALVVAGVAAAVVLLFVALRMVRPGRSEDSTAAPAWGESSSRLSLAGDERSALIIPALLALSVVVVVVAAVVFH